MKDDLLIERREYKFLTDEATARAVRAAALPFCELDAHGSKESTGDYLIDSLYFDTPEFALYQANERQQVDRFKLRIRRYPATPQGPVFLEVKRRVNDIIAKTRGRLPSSEWTALVEDPCAEIPASIRGQDRAAVERFLCLVHTYRARPVALVRYRREAYVSQIDQYARVTIDRQICSQRRDRVSMEASPTGWLDMDHPGIQQDLSSLTVVELKFTSAVPRWMINLVQSLDLFRSSFSKYGSAIETWYARPVPLDRHAHGVVA